MPAIHARVLHAAPTMRHAIYSQVGGVECRGAVLNVASDRVLRLEGDAGAAEGEEEEERGADELAQAGNGV